MRPYEPPRMLVDRADCGGVDEKDQAVGALALASIVFPRGEGLT